MSVRRSPVRPRGACGTPRVCALTSLGKDKSKGSLWEGAGFLRSKKTEGECIKTHSPSVKTFGFATFLPEEGKGLYNNSELRITNYELFYARNSLQIFKSIDWFTDNTLITYHS